MEQFSSHSGIGVPLRRSDVDTDQIIPAVYLKRVTRSGFEDALFAAWRSDPAFVLNQAPYAAGSVLVAGADFGTGSSREHAVWALMDYGFRVVIAPRFADIFRNNAAKAGLLTALVTQETVEALWTILEETPGERVTIDLEGKVIRVETMTFEFSIDDHTRRRLLLGLDDISATLAEEAAITEYEAKRASFKPATWPIRSAD